MSRRRPRRPHGSRGFSLVELLVASAIGAILLAGAWPWCWSLVRSSSRAATEAEAETALCFAGRLFQSEMRRASGLAPATAATQTANSVTVVLPPSAAGPAESVTYRYDPVREVLWRNAPGSYVVDRLASCRFTFYAADGAELPLGVGGTLPPESVPLVRLVCLTAARRAGDTVIERRWSVSLRVD